MIQIINADVIAGLKSLPEKSVHCVVTSPPYWGLRDYGVEGQIGLEETPEEYVSKMVQVFREVRRVLRDDGTVWLNLGDCYIGGNQGGTWTGQHNSDMPAGWTNRQQRTNTLDQSSATGLPPKNLVGQPWRVAFALQADGWYLRSDIIWSKPNPMPESVTDRPTKSHEYVFLLTKKARYFYDADAVREASIRPDLIGKSRLSGVLGLEGQRNDCGRQHDYCDPAGRNRRTVWEIATQPTPEAHFATFPEALVEPCIKAGTSERGCCSVCGAPWVRVVEKGELYYTGGGGKTSPKYHSEGWMKGVLPHHAYERVGMGWQPSCTCNAEIVPCVVLDPFGGSGTVAKVARDLNRDAILIELNPAYVEIARRKLRANEQLFENVKVITA